MANEGKKPEFTKGSASWREQKQKAKAALDNGTWKDEYGGLSERRQKEKQK